jgi:hypothetical protein
VRVRVGVKVGVFVGEFVGDLVFVFVDVIDGIRVLVRVGVWVVVGVRLGMISTRIVLVAVGEGVIDLDCGLNVIVGNGLGNKGEFSGCMGFIVGSVNVGSITCGTGLFNNLINSSFLLSISGSSRF